MTTDGRDEIFVATRSGMGIKFSEEDVRPMGRTATGVKAITLKEDDYVVSAVKIDPEGQLLNVTENGYGKRTTTDKFNLQHRRGYHPPARQRNFQLQQGFAGREADESG